MFTLTVKCLKCGKEWTKESKIEWPEGTISSSICKSCYREIIHDKFEKKGEIACFGDVKDCKKTECKYYDLCQCDNKV